jgi:AcrR family transcriptional regulator
LSTQSKPALRRGRPRDAGADDAILSAAVDVLAEGGIGAFTVDAVAARAGRGKATIYRRWPSRRALLCQAARRVGAALAVPDPDTGALAADARALAGAWASMAAGPVGRALPPLFAEAAVDPAMRATVTAAAEWVRATPRQVVRRAVARGELPPGTDPDVVVDLLAVPVLLRAVTGAPVGPAFLDARVGTALAGLGWRPPRSADAAAELPVGAGAQPCRPVRR